MAATICGDRTILMIEIAVRRNLSTSWLGRRGDANGKSAL